MKKSETIQKYYERYGESKIIDTPYMELVYAAMHDMFAGNEYTSDFQIVSCTSGSYICKSAATNAPKENVLIFDRDFAPCYEDDSLTHMEDIEAFYRQIMPEEDVQVHTSETLHKTIVVFKSARSESYVERIAASVMERLASWIVEPKNEEFRNLSSAIFKRQDDDIEEILQRVITTDYAGIMQLKAIDRLKGCINENYIVGKKREIKRFKENITEHYSQITSNRRALRTATHDLDDYILSGKTSNKLLDELKEYIRLNNDISLVDSGGNKIRVRLEKTLKYSMEEAQMHIDNENSYFYEDSRYPYDGFHNTLRKIFIEQKYEIRVRTYFDLNFDPSYGLSFYHVQGYEMPGDNDITMPQPHLDRYDCDGGNYQKANDFLQEQDFISAFAQIEASSCSFEISDVAVGEGVLEYWDTNRYRCLRDEEGNMLTFDEVYSGEGE